MNDTSCPLNVPGYTHNGDCSLICKPTEWTDIAIFFLGNYAAHAATVIGRPGQSDLTWVLSIIVAICFPGGGVLTGTQAILSRAVFASSDLTKAARAGALCIVAKAHPAAMGIRVGSDVEQASAAARHASLDVIDRLGTEPDEDFPPLMCCSKVQGVTRLPRGYRLLVLPRWTTFQNDTGELEEDEKKIASSTMTFQIKAYFSSQKRLRGRISCSYNLIKVMVSLGQLIFAATTLYQSRGDQIEVFGHAAFGLTVAPYVWMSFVNLVGSLMCPQYETMFLVNSPTLDELRRQLAIRGLLERYQFDCTVGRISSVMESRVLSSRVESLKAVGTLQAQLDSLDATKSPEQGKTGTRDLFLSLFIAAIPILIVGTMSGFDKGQATVAQRAWTLAWLCAGPLVGVGYGTFLFPLFESRPTLWRGLVGDIVDVSKRPGGRRLTTPELRTFQAVIYYVLFLSFMVYMIPPVGAFVQVSKMLQQYGTCTKAT